ncbi:MAG: hypothetical protein ACI8V2_003689 [Candidatus Latescibacterota bacterium]|jgi:hypothetical protein
MPHNTHRCTVGMMEMILKEHTSKRESRPPVVWAVVQLVCGVGGCAGRVEHEVGCGNCAGR